MNCNERTIYMIVGSSHYFYHIVPDPQHDGPWATLRGVMFTFACQLSIGQVDSHRPSFILTVDW